MSMCHYAVCPELREVIHLGPWRTSHPLPEVAAAVLWAMSYGRWIYREVRILTENDGYILDTVEGRGSPWRDVSAEALEAVPLEWRTGDRWDDAIKWARKGYPP